MVADVPKSAFLGTSATIPRGLRVAGAGTGAGPGRRQASNEGPQPKLEALAVNSSENYLRILVTVPEPTVRPPSRIAKPWPSSMAMG